MMECLLSSVWLVRGRVRLPIWRHTMSWLSDTLLLYGWLQPVRLLCVWSIHVTRWTTMSALMLAVRSCQRQKHRTRIVQQIKCVPRTTFLENLLMRSADNKIEKIMNHIMPSYYPIMHHYTGHICWAVYLCPLSNHPEENLLKLLTCILISKWC